MAEQQGMGLMGTMPEPNVQEQGLGLVGPPKANLLEQAKQQYPYLRDKNISLVETPNKMEDRKLEYWAPGDSGWEWRGRHYMRPLELPSDTHGIQVFHDTRPIDVLADFVSHGAVNTDPTLKKLYTEFENSLDESTMKKRYAYHKDQLGETRPYQEWLPETGTPEMFRGYTFDQFGQGASALYKQNQLDILDKVKTYLGLEDPEGLVRR